MKLCALCLALLLFSPALQAATVTIQGSQTNQVIEGFGVNANHRSWNNSELVPVLDALIDQAGMTLFRVIYDNSDWEGTNDNADSSVFNWDFYNAAYSSVEFTKLWDMVAYLNQRGITNGAILNFMGYGPAWLCGSSNFNNQVLTAGLEDEWAEMIASAVIYARNTGGLHFRSVMPDNEPDILREGIHVSGSAQYVTMLHKLAQKLDANDMSDVRLIGPDFASTDFADMSAMMGDALVMSKVEHLSTHGYSAGSGSAGVLSFLQSSAYPDRNFWQTEFNVWCSTCDNGTRGTYDWTYCEGTANYLLSHLANGASAGLVYEGYDSYYAHHGAWGFWGIFAVDNENAAVKTYTPRKNFYTLAQITKWVRPGAQRINISGTTSPFSPLLAFKHSDLGQITIVGINTSTSATTLSGTLASLPTVPSLNLYYTSATTNLASGGSVTVNNGSFSATIPGDCVFTLSGFAGVNVAITDPVNGAQFNEPATIPIAATATTTGGSIALVGFYSGTNWLGDDTGSPYGITWDNVPMGDYSLTALAGDSLGKVGTSAVVNVAVVGPIAKITVTPTNATVATGGTQQFTATGADMLGHTLNPQPAYSWSVSGGGMIGGTGLFTAGSSAGGPFNVVASSGGITKTATVSVASSGGGTVSSGTFGNTNEGTSADGIWDGGAWINASRFQASSNMTVSTMRAKVAAVTGKYKCAIYTGSSSAPSRLLRSAAEVTNPATGWQTFPLTSAVTLTNGQYYWLAIWSDNSSAKVYYSGSNGALRWGRYNYAAAWPDPISTSGGNSFNYCIYATGTAATLVSMAVTPASPVILAGRTQQFVATGTYSDGSTQNITSQATWVSSNAVVATVNASGLATGVSAGTANISASLSGRTGSAQLTVQTPVVITTSSLPGGTVNANYSAGLAANGGTSPYTWTIAGGTLPAGLTLDTNSGAISGTPTVAGTNNLTVRVTDSGNPVQTTNKALSIVITKVLSSIAVTPVSPVILVGGTQQFVATGTYSDGSTANITSQATWVSSNILVATVNASGLATGVSGGTANISATLSGVSGTASVTVQVPVTITTSLLSTGTVSMAYSASLTASGGTAPYTWAITVGTLPTGLTLDTNSGAITGTPTTNGTFSFTVRVSDAGNPVQNITKALSITVAKVLISIAVTPVTPVILVGGTQQFVATGTFSDGSTQNITSQATWISSDTTAATVNASGLATGVSSGTATISATIPSAGTATILAMSGDVSGSALVTVQVPVVITTSSLPGGTVNASYSATLAASGGTSPYTWTITVGTLPAGLTLETNSGAISGISTVAGTNNFTVRVTDTGNPVQTTTKALSIVITKVLSSIAVMPVSPTILTGGTQQFVATGTYSDGSTQNITSQTTWVSSNAVVATVNAIGLATGASAGTANISATSSGVSGSALLTVQIPVVITTSSLPAGTVNGNYSTSLVASGGTSPYTWTITVGILPAGLTLDTNSGAITGTPTIAGTNNFTVRVSDSGSPGQSITKVLSITVTKVLSSIAVTPANPVILVGGTQQFVATGTYSDGSTQNITSQATWVSSNAVVATVNVSGLATGASAGTANLSATLSGVIGSAQLTVQAVPLVFTTTSLSTGTVSVAYSATLAASGGTTPYRWSLLNGSLPQGLTLNTNSGAISGTPTTNGTFNFNARVNDSGNPVQTTNKALSITIVSQAGTTGTIGNTNEGTSSDNLWDAGAWINAARFQATSNFTVGTMKAKVAGITGKYKCAIYGGTGSQPSQLLGQTTEVTNPTTGWQSFPLTSSVSVTNGQYYWLAVWSDNANARVYYSGSNGTLRWSRLNYGTWPSPLSTSGGGTLNYCIYATK